MLGVADAVAEMIVHLQLTDRRRPPSRFAGIPLAGG